MEKRMVKFFNCFSVDIARELSHVLVILALLICDAISKGKSAWPEVTGSIGNQLRPVVRQPPAAHQRPWRD
ncbi:unnamed protein product [Didymodactylos carnosus]|uniref:Uncharacterized protein n=2 Tax=Didymodactylos carnosus TaxID=1234261 RepID=A0A815NH38_9BILA|nr:unnamed protein product [Didymodactylos carnosus]CAF4315234.1 unnamed protein product [Didymodactylos carnosus]